MNIADRTWEFAKKSAPTLYGLLITLVLLGVLTLIFTAIIFFSDLSESYLRPAGIIISVISLLCGGFIAGRKGGSHGLWRGLALGILYVLILCILAATSDGTFQSLITKAGYSLLSATIGGICGVKQ